MAFEQMQIVATFVGYGECESCQKEFDDLMAYHTLPRDPILCDSCAAKAGIPMKVQARG